MISILSLSLYGQDKDPKISKTGFWIGTDLSGITLMPLSSALILDRGTFVRQELQLGYQSDNILFGSMAIGRDQRNGEPVYTNVYDYSQTSIYFKFSAGLRSNWASPIKPLVALGGFYGSTRQAGSIVIGEGYFDPFMEDFSIQYKELGWTFASGVEFPIADRLGLELFVMQTIGRHTDETPYSVVYTAGAGENFVPTGSGFWSLSFRCNLTFSLNNS